MFIKKTLSSVILCFFLLNSLGLAPLARAQESAVLPPAGALLALSPVFAPPLLKGIKVYPNDPFRFDFILDKGESPDVDTNRLIKYFLAAVTVPEKDLWVNLSPYEKDRIVPEAFGRTEMGRDLLAQDYILKQITASIIDPEQRTGREFWDKVYSEAFKRYGTTDIPVDSFNKVWILPEQAKVYENNVSAFIVDSRFKVMLDTDYMASRRVETENLPSLDHMSLPHDAQIQELSNQVMREVIIPILEKEVNEGRNFAQLRQIMSSFILASWYKKKLKDSILSQGYVDQNKTGGINIPDVREKDKIYQQYLQAFKQGVYNYVKEEVDVTTQEVIPRKYFSGGITLVADYAMATFAQLPLVVNEMFVVSSRLNAVTSDNVMKPQASQEGYEKFRRWLENVSADPKMENLYPADVLRTVFNRKFEHLEALCYWRLFQLLRNDPLRAYQMSFWDFDQLDDLFRMFDSLANGADTSTGYQEENPVRYLLGNMLRDVSLELLDDPERLLTQIKDRLRAIINDDSVHLAINIYHMASVHAAKGLIDALKINKDRITLLYAHEIDDKMALHFFPGYQMKRADLFTQKDTISIGFNSWGKKPIYFEEGASSVTLLLVPFKYSLPARDPEKISAMRESLGIGEERKVIVVGSPETREFKELMKAYNLLYRKLPVPERPLIIVAFRDINQERVILENKNLADQSVIVRSNEADPLPNVKENNVLVLNTMGELAPMYALGNVAFVGHDRNMLEPASLQVAILHSQGSWFYNRDGMRRIFNAGASVIFSKDKLQRLMDHPEEALEMGTKGREVVEGYRKDIQASAENAALQILGARTDLRNKFIASLNVLAQGVDKAQESASSNEGYERFRRWFEKTAVHHELIGDDPVAELTEVFGRKIGDRDALQYYWRIFLMLRDDPERAYQMSFWNSDQLAALYRLFDSFTTGFWGDPSYRMKDHVRDILEITIRRSSLKLLSDPERFLEQHKAIWRAVIKDMPLEFDVYHIASAYAVKGFIKALGLVSNKVTILYKDEISETMAKEIFPGYRVEAMKLKNKMGVFRIEFTAADDGVVLFARDGGSAKVALTPFKYSLPARIPEEISAMRKSLGIKNDRKVIVVGSPSDREFNAFMNSYNSLYGQLAAADRPLIIVAFREIWNEESILKDVSLQGQSVVVRNNKKDPLPNVKENNVLVMNTMGELLKVYGLGDVALVGEDRNMLEPVSLEVATMFFPGNWSYNLEGKSRVSNAGGAVLFTKNNLKRLLDHSTESLEMGKKGRIIVDDYQKYIEIKAEEAILKVIGATPKLRDKFLVSTQKFTQSGDKAQAAAFDKGGIDLTPVDFDLQVQRGGKEIQLNVNPELLRKIQNAQGFSPEVLSIYPLNNLSQFLLNISGTH